MEWQLDMNGKERKQETKLNNQFTSVTSTFCRQRSGTKICKAYVKVFQEKKTNFKHEDVTNKLKITQ